MLKDKDTETEEDAFRLVGFTTIPIFGYSQTEGEPLAGLEEEQASIDARA
jgi:hypothetical protein